MPTTCKRVFVIGLDGAMGRAVQQAETPHIDAFLAGGVVTYAAQSVVPSASFEAWGAMFHGVGPEKHRIDGRHPCGEDVPWPSFMKVVKQRQPEAICASFSCWNPINTHIIEPSCECHTVSQPDPELTQSAVEYIRRTPPHVYFMQLDFIDGAGHSHGYGSDAYMAQITTADAWVGQILQAIQDAGVLEESLVVILSDHGGTGHSHGSDHPDCLEIVWGCRGPGVRSGQILDTPVHIADTAPVALHALGITAPKGWDATVPEGVFLEL